MIDNMKSGSIIFDLAVAQGGNAAYSEVDKIVNRNGTKIIGISNVMNKLPLTASNLYAKIYLVLLEIFTVEKNNLLLILKMKLIKTLC